MDTNIYSPIGIDLGAKYTGVYMNQYRAGEMFFDGDQRQILVTDENAKIWLQKSRTAVRHARRGRQRRKLAKRFLKLILTKELKIENLLSLHINNTSLEQSLMGLLNRRGFSFLTEDTEELLEELNLEPLRLHLSWLDKYQSEDDFRKFFLSDLSSENVDLKNLNDSLILLREFINSKATSGKRGFKYQEADKHIHKNLKMIEDVYAIYKKSKLEGQKHRKEYLTNIKYDIPLILKKFNVDRIDKELLYRLIGNVSNLQERVLRKYFNNIEYQKEDLLENERLDKILSKYLSRWSPDKNVKNENLNCKTAKLYAAKGWRKFFFELDPTLSIPPYENQNNRSPQKCQSLILNPKLLSKQYPGWIGLCNRVPTEEAVEISQIHEEKQEYKLTRKLQFFLDRSYKEGTNKKIEENLRVLSTPTDEKLKKVMQQYYNENYQARYGIWDSEDSENLMSACLLKTKHKSNMNEYHLKAIVGIQDNHLLIEIMTKKKNSLFKKSAEALKEYGNRLNWYLKKDIQKSENKSEQLIIKELKKLDNEIKEFCLEIRTSFKEINTHKFNNIYSFAQIYSIVFDIERSGFTKSCLYCTIDNENRMMENKNGASATRLGTSTARPIDGSIGRILDHVAWEITLKKVEQIEKFSPFKEVNIPIFIEQNSFEFQESLIQIKRKDSGKGAANFKKSLKKAEEKNVKSEKYEGSKFEKIKHGSKNICAYTGETLSDLGEFDHIIPASFSKNSNQSILNSAANLIYVSSDGNAKKGQRSKDLSDLHQKYLYAHFATDSISEITNTLKSNCSEILNNRSTFDDQDIFYLRHGLFIQELRSDIIRAISFSTRSKVNGTQKYFATLLAKKLKDELKSRYIESTITINIVRSDEVAIFRTILSQKDQRLSKNKQNQSASSHIIDGFLTMLVGMKNLKDYSSHMQTHVEDEKIKENCLNILEKFTICKLSSKEVQSKKDIESKNLFLDSIYGESLMSLLYLKDGTWKRGFDIENSIALKKMDKNFELLTPFLSYKGQDIKNLNLKNEIIHKDYIYFTFNKREVFAYINSHKNTSNKEVLNTIVLLNSFIYSWKRANVSQVLIDKDGKLINNPEDKIKKELTLEKDKIVHPCHKEWIACLSFIKEKILYLDKKINVDQLNLQLIEKFGKNTNTNEFKHKGVNKVFSLPWKGGGNTRIRRFSPKREEVFQLLSSEANIGEYLISNGEGEHDLLPIFKGENIVSVNNIGKNIKGERFNSQLFYKIKNLPKEVKEKGVLEYSISPKTSSRFYGELKINKNSFFSLFDSPPSQLDSKMLIKKGKILGLKELGDARDEKINIREVDENFIVFSYQMSGSTKEVKALLHDTLKDEIRS